MVEEGCNCWIRRLVDKADTVSLGMAEEGQMASLMTAEVRRPGLCEDSTALVVEVHIVVDILMTAGTESQPASAATSSWNSISCFC